VQGLSKEVHERVDTLTQIITKNLQQESERREQDEHDAVSNITETLGTLGDNLMILVANQRDTLSKVESENESMAQTVMDAIGGVQFQDIIRQQLEHLINMAEMVNEHMQTVGAALNEPQGDFGPTCISQKFDDLFDSYVMESQRVTHLSAEGQEVAIKSLPSIELF
jgi:hypothetical protein